MNRDGGLVAIGLGAFVTVLFSFIPCSPVLGGVAAASRRDDGYRSGLGLGAAAGVVAMVPLGALVVPAIWITWFLGYGIPPESPEYDVFLGLVALFFLLYTVGLSALGGVLGVWVRENTTLDLDPLGWI